MGRADDAEPIGELLDERRHLLDLVCWMLGNGSAAERVVDDTYRRWYALSDDERARIELPRGWLVQVAGGLCLARPVLPGQGTPAEIRAGTSRAGEGAYETPGRETGGTGPTDPTGPRSHDELVRAVQQACTAEDVERLAALLAPDVTVLFDGGGKVRALIEPVHGSRRVARSLLTLLARRPSTTLHVHSVNGRTGLVVRYDEQVAAVMSLDVVGGQVVRVWVVLNPDKLRSWNRPGVTREE